MMALIRAAQILIKHECLLAYRYPMAAINPVLFFILVVLLFPLALNAGSLLLHTIGPVVLWIGILLAMLLAFPRLFEADFEDGSLEQLVLSPHPLPVLLFAKMLAHWCVAALPLILLAPCLGLIMGLKGYELKILVLGLLLGTPVVSLLGGVGAALTLGLEQGGLLLALLLLPLYIPLLIFGVSSVSMAAMGSGVSGQLAILAAMLILALISTPFAIASILSFRTG